MMFRNQMILNCEQGTICKPSSDAQNRDHSWPRPTRLQHTIRGQHPTAGAGVNRTLSMTVGWVRAPLSQAVGFLQGRLFTAFCFGKVTICWLYLRHHRKLVGWMDLVAHLDECSSFSKVFFFFKFVMYIAKLAINPQRRFSQIWLQFGDVATLVIIH